MLTFICYPKCTTCQKARKWLDENRVAYSLRDIKTENPSYEELAQWHKLSGLLLKKFSTPAAAVQIHGAEGQAARHEREGDTAASDHRRDAGQASAFDRGRFRPGGI